MKHTEPRRRVSRKLLARGRASLTAWERRGRDRPRTVAECRRRGLGAPARPCGFVACRYHLALDVSARTGTITIHAPFAIDADGVPVIDVAAMRDTCALVAARGGAAAARVGAALGLTPERVHQIEVTALARLAQRVDAATRFEPGAAGWWDALTAEALEP